MSKVDDELTRRFRRVERPVDIEGLFEGLERRRSHREHVRRIQAFALAFAVLAGSLAGFVALRSVFLGDERTTGDPALLPSNGEIVFSRQGPNGRSHLYATAPGGDSTVRQVTDDPTNDTDPAISPDGRTIAFVRESEQGRAIATVPIAGGRITRISPDSAFAHDPAWSPDGSRIVYAASGIDSTWFEIVSIDAVAEGPTTVSPDQIGGQLAHPTWSPDGSSLAFATLGTGSGDVPVPASPQPVNDHSPSWDLETMGLGAILQIADRYATEEDSLISTGTTTLVATERDEESPAWSLDGSRIAFTRPGDEGDEVWTIDPESGNETLLATAVETSLEPDLAWAPDGTALLVSDGEWIYRVDASLEGDPRDNFVQLFRGFSPSWQPNPTGTAPSAASSPEPAVSASPAPEGSDIGLGVRMCDLEVLRGIDWDGTGIDGAAWTGAPVDENGRCSTAPDVQHIVAVDRDGNGVADHGGTSVLTTCLLCRPFATVDLNSDGVLELVVLDEASSTPTYSLYVVNNPGSERAEGVYPIFVVPPAAPAMNLDANEPARVTVGGDEGFSGSIVCEEGGEGPPIVLHYTWVRGAVDADTDLDVDVSQLYLGDDGVLHVDSVDSFSVPRDQGADLTSTAPACGVDFHPAP